MDDLDTQPATDLPSALRCIAYLEGLDDSRIEHICDRARACRYDEGESIIGAGERVPTDVIESAETIAGRDEAGVVSPIEPTADSGTEENPPRPWSSCC